MIRATALHTFNMLNLSTEHKVSVKGKHGVDMQTKEDIRWWKLVLHMILDQVQPLCNKSFQNAIQEPTGGGFDIIHLGVKAAHLHI